MQLATSVEEYEALGLMSEGLVRSRAGWHSLRQGENPLLSRLSAEAIEQFEDSMTYSPTTGCLKSANCERISYELGEDLPQFFELFGIDRSILGIFYPYRCRGPRGCERFSGWYCFQTAGDPCSNGG